LYPIPNADSELRRAGDAGRGARVGTGQPGAQLVRGFIGRLPVEGHQGRGHARHVGDVRSPTVLGDGNDLDQVRASSNGFFKTMDGGAHLMCKNLVWGSRVDFTRHRAAIKRSAGRRRVHIQGRRLFCLNLTRKNFRRRVLHRKCTVHPQVLHSTDLLDGPLTAN